MITRFFKTSRPIHFVILIAYIVIMFLVSKLKVATQVDVRFFMSLIPMILVLIATLFLLDFFVRKNDLTFKNNFKILIYSLLLVAFPTVFLDHNLLLANLFIFMALRRIISIRSQIDVKKKLFDAAFWIGIASLFYFWAILFFLLIIVALVLYGITQFRNWIVPFVGVVTAAILMVSYHLILGDSFKTLLKYVTTSSLDFSYYKDISLIVSIIIITSLSIWALLHYIINLKEKTRSVRPSHILVIISLCISVALIIMAPNKNGTELIFSLAPLTIIIVNFIERIRKIWFSEIVFWLLILLPQTTLLS